MWEAKRSSTAFSVPAARVPPLSSARHVRVTHAAACLAVVAGAAYLGWRVVATLGTGTPWLNITLLATEAYVYFTMVVFLFMTWDTEQPAPFEIDPSWTVDIFIPTYNEPEEILRATALAARAVAYPHGTFILDDGRRPEIRKLAEDLGCTYLVREDNKHAKAGNLNAALAHSKADFIAIFDADHAAQPTFLARTLGYFCDQRLGFVQTPQDFYNLSSVQHGPERGHWHEQTLFYEVIQPGKNRTNSAFFCGSCAILRRSAIDSIGGFATRSVTEDLLTALRLHRAGWRSYFHREPLAYGIAPDDAQAFVTQRLRWAQGTMQVLRSRENPLFGRGLTVGQRISYIGSMMTYFDSVARTVLAALPLLVLGGGVVPYTAATREIVPMLGIYLTSSIVASTLAQRGKGNLIQSERFAVAKSPIFLRAITTLLTGGRKLRFAVTPKRVSAQGGSSTATLLRTSSFVFLGTVVFGVFGFFGLGPAGDLAKGIVVASLLWSSVLCITTHIASTVYAQQPSSRVAYRFPWAVPVACQIRRSGALLASVTQDISWSGAGISDPDQIMQLGDEIDLRLWLGSGEPIGLSAVVTRAVLSEGRVGVVFVEPSPAVRDRLILGLVTAGSNQQDRDDAHRWEAIYHGMGRAA